MLNISLTQRVPLSLRSLVKSLCLAAGMALAFAPCGLTAQEKKPAAPAKEAPAEEEKDAAAPATPRNEEAALKEFKADMLALKTWTQAQQAKAKQNPKIGRAHV